MKMFDTVIDNLLMFLYCIFDAVEHCSVQSKHLRVSLVPGVLDIYHTNPPDAERLVTLPKDVLPGNLHCR